MNDDAKLLVPMYMEALLLGNDQNNVDLSPQLFNFKTNFLGDQFQPNANNKIKLGRGIHLHWTLPMALKHSFLDEGAQTSFPLIPNRWMVTRIGANAGISNFPIQEWIVESAFENEIEVPKVKGKRPLFNPNHVVTAENQNSLVFKNVGKPFPYNTFADNPQANSLTAVQAANPYFASFYPGCQNILGFYDDMTGIANGTTLTYIVTGWYSNPTDDPLYLDFVGEPQTDIQKKRKKELDWFKKQWKYNGPTYPSACILHAAIHSILWDDTALSGVPDGAVNVFVGNTSAEAFSANIRAATPNANATLAVEDLLNALQYQLLDDDHNPPNLPGIKAESQKRAFKSKKGGIIWEITPIVAGGNGNTQENSGATPQFPPNQAILLALNNLNAAQVKLNISTRKLSRLQQEYYFLWHKQAQTVINAYPTAPFDYVNTRAALLQQIQLLQTAPDGITSLTDQVGVLKIKLLAFTEMAGTAAKYQLTEKQESNFWEPNEPVVLLSGSGIGSIEKPNLTAEKEIFCRDVSQLGNVLNLNVPSGSNNPIPVTIDAKTFNNPAVNGLNASFIPSNEIQSIIYEALLFDKRFAPDIALAAFVKANLRSATDPLDAIILNFASTVVAKTQQDILDTILPDDGKYLPVCPPAVFSIIEWQQAWSPLFMAWEVKFSPTYPDITNLDLCNSDVWKLDDNLFFKNYKEAYTNPIDTVHFISPFSSSALSNIRRVLPATITDAYGKMNLIAQALSGLHKTMLMQRPTIQMPPFAYAVIYDNNKAIMGNNCDFIIDQNELNTIGTDAYKLGSDPGDINFKGTDKFYPMRSGMLAIVNLSIIDAFGQQKEVINVNDNPNYQLTCANNIKLSNGALPNYIPLAPRMLQPSRLNFEWLNLNDEIVYQGTDNLDSPVFGWAVPNYLDNSLMIYDQTGNEVIVLQITIDISQEKGLSLNKAPFPGAGSIPSLAANKPLQGFIDAINSGPVAAGLIDLALQVNLNVTGTNALHNNSVALICGQPIALARCSVQIEQYGLAAFNQSWAQSGKENAGGIDTVKIPLLVGDFTKDKDGLIGYFLDNDTAGGLYTTANAPEFNYSQNTFFKNSQTNISISQGTIKLTVLLDPAAGLHISTGILPVKFEQLFANQSKDILASLNIGFMAAPFIADKVDPGVPVPSTINANWKWAHKTDVNTWASEIDVPDGKNKSLSDFNKQKIYEGWLKISNLKNNN